MTAADEKLAKDVEAAIVMQEITQAVSEGFRNMAITFNKHTHSMASATAAMEPLCRSR